MHYVLFMIQIHHLYFPVSLTTGPKVSGHPGFNTQHGLVAFLRLWAEHRAHHQGFCAKAWGVHYATTPPQSLVGSTLRRIHLHELASWRCHGHLFERFGAYIRGHLIRAVTVRVK